MNANKPSAVFSIWFLILFKTATALAQAPIISYQTPQTYNINQAISPLAPKNTGGAVPPNNYGQVTTFAGTGVTGSTDGTGTAASFSAPIGLTVDGSGNIFVADYNNNTIRKITPSGVVTTLAGTAGVHGSANGSGSTASFAEPNGVAADKNGNIYVADAYNNLVRKVTAGGAVTTFAGHDGVRGSADGAGPSATFSSPAGVAVDKAGNVYIADRDNNMIRMITPSGDVTTLAGSATPGKADGVGLLAMFNQPESLTVDGAGNVYVADAGNNVIRKISPGGLVSTLAGSGIAGASDGLGAAASFNQPYGIAIDNIGTLYVADEKNNAIRKITPNGMVSTLAGDGVGGSNNGIGQTATFAYPGSVASDGIGNVYVGDLSTYLIRKIGLTGYTIDKILPPGLVFDPTTGIISGTPIAASPATDYTVTAYNISGSSATVVNIAVDGASAVPLPPKIAYQTPQTYTVGAAISPLGPTNAGGAVPATIYGQVSTFAGNGTKGAVNGNRANASFNFPKGLNVDASGNMYVADRDNFLIRKISPGGVVSTFAGSGTQGNANGQGIAASFNGTSGIVTDAAGNLYLADSYANVIRKITPAGAVSAFAGTGAPGHTNGPAASATFNNPEGVALDEQGNLYIVEFTNMIRKISPAGIVSTLAGDGSSGSADGVGTAATFNNPTSIAIDAAGNAYVTDSGVGLIRKISPAGAVTMLTGNGISGTFQIPEGVAIDAAGNIYIICSGNQSLYKINTLGQLTTLATGLGSFPGSITGDVSGNLYISDPITNSIFKVVTTGYTIDKPLPAGLNFDATTGVISGTPITASPATDYTITAYNTGGSSSAVVNITITDEQTVIFGPIPVKTACDADFDPGAIANAAITYTSNNAGVATVAGGKVHITGPGTATITASDGTSQASQILTVTAALTPSLVVSPLTQDNCQGVAVTYMATPTNGGSSPAYQWQVNGRNAGTNSPQFTSNALNNNDLVTCTLTSSAVCTTTTTVTSNAATFIIDPPVSTSVSIISTAAGAVCAGTPLTFIATPVTPDANPVYKWQVNGVNADSQSAVFTSTVLGDGDVVTCVLTSIGKCLTNADATSNAVKISLSPASACLVVIPNTFTPNGDGINDLWNISALQGYPDCAINIFNRYGAVVYNSIGYTKAWDGNFKGKALPTGTYYYIIDLKNGKNKIAGAVTIVR